MLFADFLNYAMGQANLTNYKLAKRIGVSQSTIANWSNGITEPREKRRSEVLDLFGVDEYDLEQNFPEIHYKSDEQKENPASEEAGFNPTMEDWLNAIDRMSREEMRAVMSRVMERYAGEDK